MWAYTFRPGRGIVSIALAVLVATGELEAQSTEGIAVSEAATAAIARRTADGSFKSVPEKAQLAAEELHVLLPDASLINAKKSARLMSRADFEGTSALPILETAVMLHKHAVYDLDFTLDRGRVQLENTSTKGPVRVLARFHQQRWLLTLEKPGTKVAIELSGRWAPGTRFVRNPAPNYEPITSVIVLVIKGDVEVDTNETTFALTAPPGPAMLSWESTAGLPRAALRVDKLPGWADPERQLTPNSVEYRGAIEKFRRLWSSEPDQAVSLMLASERPVDRRVGLIFAGAFDDLACLVETEATSPEVLDFGVSVLRHWLGRGTGQQEKLFVYLTSKLDFQPAAAELLIALLHGFSALQLERPETYEVLIEYLLHEKAIIRALASWHLVRLVPSGKEIPFATNNSKSEMEKVYKKWREMIPSGQLPRGIRK